jgi:pimeloyl-ACP methyl ester carboxylesterase
MTSTHLCRVVLLALAGFEVAGIRTAFSAPVSHNFDVQGVRIHYFVEGRGEPVVLIHGLHSSAGMNWIVNGVFGELAKDHQVIALDMPGHGRSDKPDDEKAYGTQIVADVLALLDHLQIKKAHIVGYSLGGMIAVKFLAMHPDRGLSGTVGGMGWFREGSRIQRIWDRLPGREGTPPAFMHSVSQLAVTEQDLKEISVPVEVVVGARDPVKRMHVDPLRPVRPDWPVVEIEEAGHISCVTTPEFRKAISDWVRKQTRR